MNTQQLLLKEIRDALDNINETLQKIEQKLGH